MWPRYMDRAAVRRRRPDEPQHRLDGVVVEDEFVERVDIERPAARPPSEGALEDREEVRVHPTGAVDVRVSREDEVHASVLVGLEQLPFDVQANPPFQRVRFLRMVLRDGPGSRTAVHVHVAGKDQGSARGFRGRGGVVRKERDEPRPLGVWDVRRMDDDIHATDRLNDGFARTKVRGDDLNPRRESSGFSARPDDGADLVARETGSAHDGASDQSPRTKDRNPHGHRTSSGAEKDDASDDARRLRARCMHQPALCPRGDGEPSTRLGEAGEGRTMGNGIKLGPRATILLVVLLAASAVGILTPTLSNTVSKDVQVTGFAVTVTVDGVPETVAPGDVFRVMATLANNANRPIPAVLRMEVRNPNNTGPNELTVYAGCGAEEVVSGTRLIYYIGWHGPLLAPKGTSFAAGTSLATVNGAIGAAGYWPPVLHEIPGRDPPRDAAPAGPGPKAPAR